MSGKELEISLSEIPSSLYELTTNVIHSYSTGLIKITRQDQQQEYATLIGSGTFVSIQGVYGILTAHHVSELLERGCSLGLILVPGKHRLTIDYQFLQTVEIARGAVESEGPDLSFILLPVSKASAIKPYKHFYNLTNITAQHW
jgi:hypothetical protein